MGVSGVSWVEPSVSDAIRWGADFGVLTLAGQWWRLLTSVFVHFGIIHLLFNMWCLWDLGLSLEPLMGRRAFALMYLASGIAASTVSLGWNQWRVSAGASGAIFGVAGALVSYLILKKAPLPKETLRRRLKSLAVFIFYNLFYGALRFGVDNSAHLGGLIAGMILGALIPAVAPTATPAEASAGGLLVGSPARLGESSERMARGAVLMLVGAGYSALIFIGLYQIARKHAAEAHYGAAALQIQRGNLAAAIPELQQSIALNPKSGVPPAVLGVLKLEQEDPIGAYPILEQAVRLEPSYRLLRHNLALAYIGAGYPGLARQEIGWALQSQEEDQAAAHFILGLCAYLERDYEQASTQLLSAIQARKDFFEAQDDLARIYIESGKAEQARALYAAVLSAHKDDRAAISGMASLKSAPKTRPTPGDLPPFVVPYSKLTAKSRLWPYFP
ncbi:MAG TPA: rhomboid family intramembrane serine protease [Candidatus Sulfotelmatobacter sp.]|nr:rhomboid family intramembrane serine protease [Candidatus Sulfotelmatobacter sp.]